MCTVDRTVAGFTTPTIRSYTLGRIGPNQSVKKAVAVEVDRKFVVAFFEVGDKFLSISVSSVLSSLGKTVPSRQLLPLEDRAV